jgi:hypothetical protein
VNHTVTEDFAIESQTIEYIPGELFLDLMLMNMVAIYNDRADTAKKVERLLFVAIN